MILTNLFYEVILMVMLYDVDVDVDEDDFFICVVMGLRWLLLRGVLVGFCLVFALGMRELGYFLWGYKYKVVRQIMQNYCIRNRNEY